MHRLWLFTKYNTSNEKSLINLNGVCDWFLPQHSTDNWDVCYYLCLPGTGPNQSMKSFVLWKNVLSQHVSICRLWNDASWRGEACTTQRQKRGGRYGVAGPPRGPASCQRITNKTALITWLSRIRRLSAVTSHTHTDSSLLLSLHYSSIWVIRHL